MIVSNPSNKTDLVKFIQSLRRPKMTYVDVLSKDDRSKVMKEFDTLLRSGPFSVILIREQQ